MLREALILTTRRGKLDGICGSNLLHRSVLNLVINTVPFQWFPKGEKKGNSCWGLCNGICHMISNSAKTETLVQNIFLMFSEF